MNLINVSTSPDLTQSRSRSRLCIPPEIIRYKANITLSTTSFHSANVYWLCLGLDAITCCSSVLYFTLFCSFSISSADHRSLVILKKAVIALDCLVPIKYFLRECKFPSGLHSDQSILPHMQQILIGLYGH